MGCQNAGPTASSSVTSILSIMIVAIIVRTTVIILVRVIVGMMNPKPET